LFQIGLLFLLVYPLWKVSRRIEKKQPKENKQKIKQSNQNPENRKTSFSVVQISSENQLESEMQNTQNRNVKFKQRLLRWVILTSICVA